MTAPTRSQAEGGAFGRSEPGCEWVVLVRDRQLREACVDLCTGAPARVRSTNPGYCFIRAGWRRCGLTKGGHGRSQLVILERI